METTVTTKRNVLVPSLILVLGILTLVSLTQCARMPPGGISLDSDDIGGVVSGPDGSEAGVWVIAETNDLATKFRKIVVTDELGRYVLPDLPEATYRIWVRGYGLIDSQPVDAVPGQEIALTAVPAPDPQAAAEIYPANYWYSLFEVPDASAFPGTGPQGNGISPEMRTQSDWVYQMKASCELCHQLGNKATREIPASLGTFESSHAAWVRRVQSGQNGARMVRDMEAFGPLGYDAYADWTDRIAAGEVPSEPPRPEGVEQNLVLTLWEWGSDNAFVHDEITTDKRNPTLNGDGLIYGLDHHNDQLLRLDPVTHATSTSPVPVRDPYVPPDSPLLKYSDFAASPYWGDEVLWTNPAHPHNPMMDQKGRVWMTAAIHGGANPEFCRAGSTHPSAMAYPLEGPSFMHAQVYDPETSEFAPIETCFSTHHLQFAEDADDTLYFSTGGDTIGWLNTRRFDETGDVANAQGWCSLVVDHNGDGVIGEYTEPNEPTDRLLDRRLNPGSYGLIVNPVDGSVWFAAPGVGTSLPAYGPNGIHNGIPGRIMRLELGDNPPTTCKTEVYEPPLGIPGLSDAYTPRSVDVDRNGLIWTALAGSGHMASFDRSKCAVLVGPTATGQHCPEGWTLHQTPGPRFKGVSDDSNADFLYFNWVDQFDTLGLGENVPFVTGSGSDALLALQPETGNWVRLRVPYPLGFYMRGMDGRIDDVTAGWKGRGVYADYGANSVWHIEGGRGTKSSVVKFQMRPDPLAK
jgi:hypothetical protein